MIPETFKKDLTTIHRIVVSHRRIVYYKLTTGELIGRCVMFLIKLTKCDNETTFRLNRSQGTNILIIFRTDLNYLARETTQARMT